MKIAATIRFPALILALLLWAGLPAMAATGPEAAPPKPANTELTSSTVEGLETAAAALTEKLEPIMAAVAELPDAFSQYADRLADPAQGPIGLWLTRLTISFLLAVALALLLPHLLIALRRRLPRRANVGSRMITAFLGDLAGLVALLIIFYAAHTSWFFDRSARSELAVSLFGGLVHWRLMMLPIDVLLRPREPEARLVEAPDRHARHMRQLASWLLGFVAFSLAGLRAMLYSGIPTPAVQFLALIMGLVNAGVALYFIHRLHDALAAGSEEVTFVAPGDPAMGPAEPTLLQQIWHPLTLAFILAAAGAWLLGVIFSDLAIFWSLIDTGAILLAVLIFQSVAAAWLARGASGAGGTDAIPAEEVRRARRHLLIRRCLGVALWIAAAVLAIEIWMARLAHILPAAQWQASRGSVISAAITLYIAYVLWQIVFLHTAHRVPGPQQPAADGSIGPTPIATRLQTMMPVLRIFMLVTIALVAMLIALSNLGVNTTSLIAGASIFGLAISFGSQSLVHDIVSGIFFMADDAFRIGEYIDTGKAKGTVEGMTVRSLRMRHQNGQIHVIPFGQIQQVTNFSRDWTTMKFNLRLALDTDVEKVRKIVKAIGADMMKDPVLAAEMYQPLKMQGVTEIDSNGLVVRLKFTTKPAQPTFVYREALKRIYKAFGEKGINFANNSVMVQTRAEPATPEDAAKLAALGAAASIASAPEAAAD